MKIKLFLFFIIGLAFMVSCNKENIDANIDYGYDYYPIDSAHTLIYRVDTTWYDEFFDTVYTHTWIVTEKVMQLDEDLEGNPRARIARTQYEWETLPPEDLIPTIFYVTQTPTHLDYQDDNVRFMKLVFPILENKEWDGNIYLNEVDFELQEKYEGWQYKYQQVGSSYEVEGITYDTTCYLNYIEEESLISRRFAEERYAKGVGLIYRKIDDLQLNTSDLEPYIGIDWPERANNGYYTEWQLITVE